ncbi:MAG: urease accessory protein UreF [Pseudomonadales bacterium]|nr:urease accessory protein UreF [Pseudomonadales bacterium]
MTMRTEPGSLYRLLGWLSPAFPVGAYTYSHGLEWAVDAGEVTTEADSRAWLEGVLVHGGGRSDAILLAHAWRAPDAAAVETLAELAVALCPSSERRLETTAQGRAFLEAMRASWPVSRLSWFDALDARALPYPIAVGVAAAGHGVPLAPTLLAYLHAFVSNLVSAAVRLVPLGQTAGQRLVAGFERQVHAVAEEAATAPLDEVGGCALLADIASMRHENQYSRLFRS